MPQTQTQPIPLHQDAARLSDFEISRFSAACSVFILLNQKDLLSKNRRSFSLFYRSEIILEINQTGVVGIVVFELAFVGQADIGVIADFSRYADAGFDAEAFHVFAFCHIA